MTTYVTNQQFELLKIELKRIAGLLTIRLDQLERRVERLEQRQHPLDARGKA